MKKIIALLLALSCVLALVACSKTDEATTPTGNIEDTASTETKTQNEVLQFFADAHQRLVEAIQSLTDDDLKRSYDYYAQKPAADDSPDRMVIWSVVGNSYGHYEEHQPWIDAIVKGS